VSLERREIVSDRAPQRDKVLAGRKTERGELTLHLVTHDFSQFFLVLALLDLASIDRGRDLVSGKLTLGGEVILDLRREGPELLLHFAAYRLPQVFDAVPAAAADQLVDGGSDLFGCLSSLFDQVGSELKGLGPTGLGELPPGRQQSLQIQGLGHAVVSHVKPEGVDSTGTSLAG
jgi:hypothetical protein